MSGPTDQTGPSLDDARPQPDSTVAAHGGGASIEVRGIGFSLTAAALRALLDPDSRGEAEVTLDLSTMAVRLPAVVVESVAKRVAPDVEIALAPHSLVARLPNQPAVRVVLPPVGTRLRVDAAGLAVGDDNQWSD